MLGIICLHRLTWTRAWSLSPPQERLTVKGMVWRPDSKVLAIAYSSEQVYLVNVENKAIINVQESKGDITCINWVQEKLEPKTVDLNNITWKNEDSNNYTKYSDFSKTFLSDPPANETLDTATADDYSKTNFLQNQNELNLLLIGTKEGLLYIKIFGCFTCAILDINEYLGYKCSIESIQLTEDLSKIFLTIRDQQNIVKIIIINSNIFRTHKKEFFAIASKYIRLIDLLIYLNKSISTITETWESILLEIDNKLSKYANKVPQGGVTADFLDLLMFGMCSNEMKEFLIYDLTKKGLEKFGETVEMSYTNIQKLLLKNITKYGQNITYHLAELRGLSRMLFKYKCFGLSEDLITAAIQSNGAFLIKTGEMLQIMNHSVINYKAFFRWLYTAIMHLMDEQIPSDIYKMTQQDLAHITEILKNFDNIGQTDKRTGFIMERLGQYLNDAPLTTPSDVSGNIWHQFLIENECVIENPNILKHFVNLSLIQQYNHQKKAVEDIFKLPIIEISKQFSMLKIFEDVKLKSNDLRMSSTNLNHNDVIYAFISSPDVLYLQQINDKCVKYAKFYFAQFLSYEKESSGNNYNIIDVKFYSTNILTILLEEVDSSNGVLLQFLLSNALKYLNSPDLNVECVNGSNLMPKVFKVIDGMSVSLLAVSGSRRVGIVLSENRRKIKLFEMEADDEDEDEAEMNSIIKEDETI